MTKIFMHLLENCIDALQKPNEDTLKVNKADTKF